MGIITVTLNPALDKTATLDTLQPGELNRLREVIVDAGGKGVNVSKVLQALGMPSLATGFLGGGSGEEIARALAALGIKNEFITIAGTTRTNLKVVDEGSRLTELNEPGAIVSADELDRLGHALQSWAEPGQVFVFSGSIPSGVSAGIYAKFIAMVQAKGAQAFLDADGEPFRAALAAKPDFIKPNRRELLEYFSLADRPTLRELAGLCRKLLDLGVGKIALSMGGEGALFVDASRAFHAPALQVEVNSCVGAGDSMVAAIAYAAVTGMQWQEAAALAMAASAGAVTTIGTKPPSRDLVDQLVKQVQLRSL